MPKHVAEGLRFKKISDCECTATAAHCRSILMASMRASGTVFRRMKTQKIRRRAKQWVRTSVVFVGMPCPVMLVTERNAWIE